MVEAELRPMRPDDWIGAVIPPGKYSNTEPLTGWRRADGLSGNPLYPAAGDDRFEEELLARLRTFREANPDAIVERRFVQMPYWTGSRLPGPDDYTFVDGPSRLTTTSVTVVLVPNEAGLGAETGFYFDGKTLPSLRTRMAGGRVQGLVGNLGYYVPEALIESDRRHWAHNVRFPQFPLDAMQSYIGFHLFRDKVTDEAFGAFQGAHPGLVGVRRDGTVEILPELQIDGYEVAFGEGKLVHVDVVNAAVPKADVMLFTPAFTDALEIQDFIRPAEESCGQDDGWQACKPMIPAGGDRVNVFIASEGNGRVPVEKVAAVWEGAAPLPSFGAVLSFSRTCFESLFDSVDAFRERTTGMRVKIVPKGADLDDYTQIMGGFVPAIVDGEHRICRAGIVRGVMQELTHHGATSPVAQCGRETQNFDPYVREPAGVLVQTERYIGWVLFDGRHELSIGASVVDVALMLKKLETEGVLKGQVQQAIFVDGGSAMKAYHVRRKGTDVNLDLLNRVAAGLRNGPGADPEGLNLYTLLKLKSFHERPEKRVKGR